VQRRYRVLRTRRGRLYKVPPAGARTGAVPPLISRHRKARLPWHRLHGHLLWTPPVPQAPAVVFTYGEPYFEWEYGTPHF
jgi:hypothetical protein